MIRVIYRKYGLRIASIWFAPYRDTVNEKKCDIAFYHQILNCDESKQYCSMFYTLNTDLSCSYEDIMSKFQKGVRRKIRQAEREGVETFLYSSKDLSEDNSIVIEFCREYNQFLKSKSLLGKCNINAINSYIKVGSFYISCARYNGMNLVYHAYIGDGNVARALYSASLFRLLNDNNEKVLVGQANRLLHWNDILSFKKIGYCVYDWGGISKDDDFCGVTEFKKGFGGDFVSTYNCIIPCSLLGRAVHRLY